MARVGPQRHRGGNKDEQQQDAQDNAELRMLWMKTTWKTFEEAIRRGLLTFRHLMSSIVDVPHR